MSNSILLNDPEKYAKTAISIIEWQLSTAKSVARIAKLNSRLVQWKKTLEILNDNESQAEQEQK